MRSPGECPVASPTPSSSSAPTIARLTSKCSQPLRSTAPSLLESTLGVMRGWLGGLISPATQRARLSARPRPGLAACSGGQPTSPLDRLPRASRGSAPATGQPVQRQLGWRLRLGWREASASRAGSGGHPRCQLQRLREPQGELAWDGLACRRPNWPQPGAVGPSPGKTRGGLPMAGGGAPGPARGDLRQWRPRRR
jgi:hypothetical protein